MLNIAAVRQEPIHNRTSSDNLESQCSHLWEIPINITCKLRQDIQLLTYSGKARNQMVTYNPGNIRF